MKSKYSLFAGIILLFTVLLLSCGPSQRELAVVSINEGKAILEKGDTLKAIAVFDSVRIRYPKAQVQIGVAKNITNDLYRNLIDNRMRQLKENELLVAQLEKGFNIEKTEYDRYAQYIPLGQTFARSWKRSFLEVNLDERGVLYLTSHYMGEEWLNHTSVRVYDQGLQASSQEVPLGHDDNRQSEFMGRKWEKVAYREGKADSVIQFIVQHQDLKLKCVFLGKKHYYILLENSDIKSVVDALKLSEAIKQKKQIEEDIARFKAR